ncbi:MAG: asparagine synthetase B family protein [Roseateles asaccharophilus]|uniref:asparagine synthetase B family protein n=1 Tax=Roseateles asaccharophilus TaxID=582607 RepID=UPI00391ADA3A
MDKIDYFAMQPSCWTQGEDQHVLTHRRADALAGAQTELNPQAIFDYLYFHFIPSPETIFKGVSRVPAAHGLVAGTAELRPLWAPRFAPQSGRSFETLKQEFLRMLRDSVASSMDGSLAACFLSGGTDSSTVAGLMRQVSGGEVHGFSIGFEAEGYDEMEYARLAARHFGVRHHEYYVTPGDLVRSIPDMAASLDQPFGNSSVLPAYYCALQAKNAGVSHLLAGDGGDELFGGNARYAKQKVFGYYERLPAPLRQHVLEPLLVDSPLGRLPLLRKGKSYIEQARVPMPGRLQMYNLLLRLGVDRVLTQDFLAQIDTAAPLRHQEEVWAWAASQQACSDLNRSLAYDWRYTLGESDLPKVRAATELAGLSVAFPMLSEDLLNFSLTLPDDYKLKGQKLRWFFKEALRGFLPDEIISKPKHGFGLPFGPWLLTHQPLHALASDSVKHLASRGLINSSFVQELLGSRLSEHPGYYGEMVWILMMLEQWLRAKSPDWRV